MKYKPTENEARIIEIFSSIQGEGTHVGEKHIFIRFEECHMHCEYCDELGRPAKTMTLDEVVCEVKRIEETEGPHQYVSLTGGEPLLYIAFLKPLMEKLKELNFKLYLETSGVLSKALDEVIDLCDVIAMDMKAQSVTKEENYDTEHREFLKIAQKKEMFVKMVVSQDLKESEFDEHVKIINEVAPNVPLILMPISSEVGEGHEDSELILKMVDLQMKAACLLEDVRIVPRFHKILNVR